MPCLLHFIKIFRSCVDDTFFHLVFPKKNSEMNQFTTNSSFPVSENFRYTLYIVGNQSGSFKICSNLISPLLLIGQSKSCFGNNKNKIELFHSFHWPYASTLYNSMWKDLNKKSKSMEKTTKVKSMIAYISAFKEPRIISFSVVNMTEKLQCC